MDRQTYLDRKGERLVVQGFRHWLSGYEFGDTACWEQAWSLYTDELGAVNAELCFTSALGQPSAKGGGTRAPPDRQLILPGGMFCVGDAALQHAR
jgi:hypothetical protein